MKSARKSIRRSNKSARKSLRKQKAGGVKPNAAINKLVSPAQGKQLMSQRGFKALNDGTTILKNGMRAGFVNNKNGIKWRILGKK